MAIRKRLALLSGFFRQTDIDRYARVSSSPRGDNTTALLAYSQERRVHTSEIAGAARAGFKPHRFWDLPVCGQSRQRSIEIASSSGLEHRYPRLLLRRGIKGHFSLEHILHDEYIQICRGTTNATQITRQLQFDSQYSHTRNSFRRTTEQVSDSITETCLRLNFSHSK